MKTGLIVVALALSGCTELNLATDYEGTKAQAFQTSIPGLDISTLNVYRSEKHPGKVWVAPNAGKKVSFAFAGRQTQFTAMLQTVVEPAYREAALSALKESGQCKIDSSVPWPTQFAIEFAYTCN